MLVKIYRVSMDILGEEMYSRKSAHAVMEAEKSHNLSSASWKPQKAGGVTQSVAKA